MFKHGFPPEWSTLKKLIWLVGSGIAGAASGIWKTVTGTLIHLTDALASPVQALSVAIEPQQSGSGDPSPTNIRPISGWTGCNINVTGKNLANVNSQTAQVGYYISAQGVITADQNNWIYKNYIPVKASTAYTLSFGQSVYYVSISEYSSASDAGFIQRDSGSTGSNTKLTITTGANTKYIRFGTNIDRTTVTLEEVLAIHWMLEEGSTASAYKPFGTTYPISWQTEAGTVYGGTLDAVNGTLTVTKATKTFDENESWSSNGTKYYINYSLTGFKTGPNRYWICNKYKYNGYASSISRASSYGFYVNDGSFGNRIVINDSNYATVDDFKNSLVGSPIVVCGDLVNTIVYTLTPEQISTLAGENNIWTDVNGEITLTYLAQG